jgi:stearoyl-CoA desaturase (delta-9 desaturase)
VSRAQRISNLVAVTVPFAGFLAAIALLWRDLVGPLDLVILAAMYLPIGFGVTVGFHRLLTHRAFRTYKPIEYALAILGSMSAQGRVIDWVADHRKHHAHPDEEGDPHSPHLQGPGIAGGLRGLWHAHVGWLLTRGHQTDPGRYARDLLDDRGMVAINRAFVPILAASLALPFALGFALGGTLSAALSAFLWGGLVRLFLLHHVTFSINSICHFFGRRRFDTADHSTNVFWLALPSLGEAWHHNHHAFPRAAHHGLRRWELDPSGMLIRLLARLRLAWSVVEISPQRQRERQVDATA